MRPPSLAWRPLNRWQRSPSIERAQSATASSGGDRLLRLRRRGSTARARLPRGDPSQVVDFGVMKTGQLAATAAVGDEPRNRKSVFVSGADKKAVFDDLGDPRDEDRDPIRVPSQQSGTPVSRTVHATGRGRRPVRPSRHRVQQTIARCSRCRSRGRWTPDCEAWSRPPRMRGADR
jgi:hypothetical protein